MPQQLPPGPRAPKVLQSVGWWKRPLAFLERNRARYGHRFTVRLLGTPPFVMISDPGEIKAVFTAPPDVLHPGDGARILEPVVGRNSVILLDEGPHLEQRKLMLPAFHGERMERLSGLMTEVAEREVKGWPRGESIALQPRMQRLTLEIDRRQRRGALAGVVIPDQPPVSLGSEAIADAHLEAQLEGRPADLADPAADGDLLVEAHGRAVVDVALGEDEAEALALGIGGRVLREQIADERDARRLEVAQEDDVVEVAHRVEVAEAHPLAMDVDPRHRGRYFMRYVMRPRSRS